MSPSFSVTRTSRALTALALVDDSVARETSSAVISAALAVIRSPWDSTMTVSPLIAVALPLTLVLVDVMTADSAVMLDAWLVMVPSALVTRESRTLVAAEVAPPTALVFCKSISVPPTSCRTLPSVPSSFV